MEKTLFSKYLIININILMKKFIFIITFSLLASSNILAKDYINSFTRGENSR